MESQALKVDLQNLILAMLRQYKNKHVLIRETIQNAIDAGAKHVKITLSRDTIQVEDDGSGMSLREIDRYWNVIARTSKRDQSGAIGEFGLGRLTLLLVSDKMFMETRKNDESYMVTTDRSGNVAFEKGDREKQGTVVWVEGDFSEYLSDFTEYASVVAKARPEPIEVNGRIVSGGKYGASEECIFSMPLDDQNISGGLWIPTEVLKDKGKKKERDATIKLFVNDLFVKDIAMDYYVFGEVNCDRLNVVTSRDDILGDEDYEKFQAKLLEIVETKFYPHIASSSALVNDARIRNDILQTASRRGDKGLIENMEFQTTSGEKVTGKEILSRDKVFVVAETNPGDMEVGDTFNELGQGVSIVAPIGLKKILDKTIGTVDRREVSQIVFDLTVGEKASPREVKEFEEVGKIVALISGFKVEYRKNLVAEAMHSLGSIIINIDSPVFKEAKQLIDDGRRDLASVRLIGVVAHELTHENHGVHDVEFYKEFEHSVDRLENKVIEFIKNRRS